MNTVNASVNVKVSLVGILLLAGMVEVTSAATVGWSSEALSLTPGAIVTLDLVGRDFNAGDLDGGGVDVTFDPTVLAVLSVDVNVADWEFFADAGVIDNSAGTVTGILFNSLAPRSGDMLFATLQFQAIGAGVTSLSLGEYVVNPFGTGGNPYPELTFSPSQVSVVPLPAPALVLGSAFATLLGLGRRARGRPRQVPRGGRGSYPATAVTQ